MAITSAAVSTHLWTASVRTGVCVDAVGSAFDVFMPVDIVDPGGGFGSDFTVMDVLVVFDGGDAIIYGCYYRC